MTALRYGIVCMKYMLFFFNLLFMLSGIGLLGLGVWARIQTKDYYSVIGSGGVTSAANIMIGAGCFILIIGIIGCFGVIKQNRCIMLVFIFFLCVVFGLEVTGGVFAIIKKNHVFKAISGNIKKAMLTVYGGNDDLSQAFTRSVDQMQEKLKCCGFNSTLDWKETDWFKNRKDKSIVTPKSCCKNQKAAKCGKAGSDNHQKGCIQGVKDFINESIGMNGIGGIGFGLGFMQIIGIVFSAYLYRAFGLSGGTHSLLSSNVV